MAPSKTLPVKCPYCSGDVADSAGSQCLECLRYLDQGIKDCPECTEALDSTGYCSKCNGEEGGESFMGGDNKGISSYRSNYGRLCKTCKKGMVYMDNEDECWDCRNPKGASATQQYPLLQSCRHTPTKVITSPDFSIWAGSRDKVKGFLSKFALVINCSGSQLSKPEHKFPKGDERFAKLAGLAGNLPPVIELDWPDMGVPCLSSEAWYELARIIKVDKLNTLVFCMGGHGRTGTAIACLMKAYGWEPVKAVKAIRKIYCKEAVESESQVEYIKDLDFTSFPPLFTAQVGEKEKK